LNCDTLSLGERAQKVGVKNKLCVVCSVYDKEHCRTNKKSGCYSINMDESLSDETCDCKKGVTTALLPVADMKIGDRVGVAPDVALDAMTDQEAKSLLEGDDEYRELATQRLLASAAKHAHKYCHHFAPTTRCGSTQSPVDPLHLKVLWFPRNTSARPHLCGANVPLEIGGICTCKDGTARTLECGHMNSVQCEHMCACKAHVNELKTCPHLCSGQPELCNHTTSSHDYLIRLCERTNMVRERCLKGEHAGSQSEGRRKQDAMNNYVAKPKCPRGYTMNRTIFSHPPTRLNPWPPAMKIDYRDAGNNPPTTMPYTCRPPKPIDITRGRQLLVDDYLVSAMSPGLIRKFHPAQEVREVMAPSKPWEVSKCSRWDYPAKISNVKLYSGKVHFVDL